MKIVYEELEPYDGSVSAEHGIGVEKRSYLHHSRNATELELMRTLKQCLDPDNILNPGKVLGQFAAR
jgi:FAD/FMN-containing dehydrogenase